jgi:hypothetical protein
MVLKKSPCRIPGMALIAAYDLAEHCGLRRKWTPITRIRGQFAERSDASFSVR